MLLLLCVACGLGISSALEATYYDLDLAEQLFEDFIITYNKTYSGQEEKQMRFDIFKKTLQIFNEKNALGGAVFAIDKFSDLANEEIGCYMGYEPSDDIVDYCNVVTDNDINTNNAPESINWVKLGAVTAVQSQKHCGSCWAFSTTGNIEGQYFLKTRKLLSFSKQELVDCSKSNNGCNGGWMSAAMIDLKKLGGIETEASYPYIGTEQNCQFDKSKVVTTLAGCTTYRLKDENKLKEVLAQRGPLTIAVNGVGMQGYTKGILRRDHCDVEPLNHAVLLVGYGTEGGEDYWIVKNSWDTTWGENGYIRISRGENTCGLMSVITCADL